MQSISGVLTLPEEVMQFSRAAVCFPPMKSSALIAFILKRIEGSLPWLEQQCGKPNMAEFWQSAHKAASASDLEAAIRPGLGKTGLMQFVEFDHGMIIRKGADTHTSRMIRLVLGNPLIMKEMAKHVPDAGSYAPVTVLVDERSDGVHVAYDRMASLLAPYANDAALEVARNLDAKVEDLLQQAAG